MSDIQKYIKALSPGKYMHLFDGDAYLEKYPMLKEKKVNPYEHWVNHGRWSNKEAPLKFNLSLIHI